MDIEEGIAINSISEDTFGRSTLVDSLSSIIVDKSRQSHPCYTIGIYGTWGEGKTSVLNMLQEQILEKCKEHNVHICRFNPWMITGQTALIQEFFDCICSDSNKTISDIIKKYGGIISYVAGGVSTAMSLVGIPVIPSVLKSAAKQVDKLRQSLPERESLAKQKEKINKQLKNENVHLIVMIDDLDRLDKEELHAVLRLIRQVADFDNTTYVLAMDETIVAKSIGDFYGIEGASDGRRFLEKIVQFPIVLPSLKPHILIKYSMERLEKILGEDIHINQDEYDVLIKNLNNLFHTKREYIRYFNQLQLTWSFVKGEVNFRDLCYLEAIKCCCVAAYNLIYQSKSLLCAESDLGFDKHFELNDTSLETDGAILDHICDLVINSQRTTIHKIINVLFPHGQSFMRTTYTAEKRICSIVYFDKYFIQSTLEDYVSDQEIQESMSMIERYSITKIAELLNNYYSRYSNEEVHRCVEMMIIRSGNEERQRNMAINLILAISQAKEAYSYGYRIVLTPNSLATDIVVNWMSKYMVQLPTEPNRTIVNQKIHDLWFEIIHNAHIPFCIALVGEITYLEGIHLIDESCYKDIYMELGKRLDELGNLECFNYSTALQKSFYTAWDRADENGLQTYLTQKFALPDFNVKEWAERWNKSGELSDFMAQFRYCLPTLEKRIKKDYPDGKLWSSSMRDIVRNAQILS